jgi:hypothetical protein
MKEENNNNEYFILVGMILFFLLGGLYFIFNLLFSHSYFSILGNFINTPVEEPVKIENVELNGDIFAKEKFKELELSNNYKFDGSSLIVGGKNPFVIKPLGAREKK